MEKQNIQDVEFTESENAEQLLLAEKDIIQGMLEAADFKSEETTKIEIIRSKKKFFEFEIRALSEAEYDSARTKHTKFVRNKQLGIKMPEDTDSVKYRSELIYMATVDKDKTWDNKKLWSALSAKGKDILTGTDVIDIVLKSGEKEAVVKQIDMISGYEDSNLEEVVKN